jgi:MYXO-CTERM domain-containing protein
MVRTGWYNLLLACASWLFMLSAAQASVASSIDIRSANFTISEHPLQITEGLIHASQSQALPSASANTWLDLRHNSIRLSPVMGFTGKPIVPARRVPFQTEVIEVFPTAMAATVQQAALTAAGDSVPDPAPLGFLGLGLIALALARRRRRKAQVATPAQEQTPEPEPMALAA